MPGMGQRGFWDKEQRVVRIKAIRHVLRRLSEWISMESFYLKLYNGYVQERKSSATRRGIYPLILFKMLVPQ